MMSRTERNAFLRRYHYRWKEVKGSWILLGPEGSYQKLDAACERFGIDIGTHRALTDAQATRQILLSLARET